MNLSELPAANFAVFDLSWSAYRDLDAVNWSALKQLQRSPAHYRHELTRGGADSDAMKLGRAVHTAVLEPEVFLARFVTFTGERRAGKEWESFKAKSEGREVLTAAQAHEVHALQSAVRSSSVAAPFLAGGKREVSLLWNHKQADITSEGTVLSPGYRVACKGRLDYLCEEGIVDLKTCRDASPDAFSAAAWRLGYLGQAAFYVDGYKAATGREVPYTIVAVEKFPPFAVAVYSFPREVLEEGRDLYRALLDVLAECRRSDRWPGYQNDTVQPLQLPRWARASDDEDIADLDLVVGTGD